MTASSSGPDKVRFFRALFAAAHRRVRDQVGERADGPFGVVAAVEGGWRKGTNRPYLPVTDRVVEAHLTGDVRLGLYPLLVNDVCRWLAADFDGPSAMLDALAYLKAAPGSRGSGGVGGVAVGDRGPCLGLLHRTRSPLRPLERSAPVCCGRRSRCAGG